MTNQFKYANMQLKGEVFFALCDMQKINKRFLKKAIADTVPDI